MHMNSMYQSSPPPPQAASTFVRHNPPEGNSGFTPFANTSATMSGSSPADQPSTSRRLNTWPSFEVADSVADYPESSSLCGSRCSQEEGGSIQEGSPSTTASEAAHAVQLAQVSDAAAQGCIYKFQLCRRLGWAHGECCLGIVWC